MSSLGFLPGRRDRSQRPSPGSQHRGLRRAHLPHAQVTPHTDFEAASRHPSARRAGTQSSPPSWSPSGRRTSQVWDPHAHVIAAKKAGHDVGRDQVARLMAMSGIWGRRASPRSDDDDRRRGADVAPDLVHRVFHAERPNALWVSDLTYVRTTEGMADVCVRRRHEVHDRRLAGRLRDDGPDGPLCPRGGPAPPGCVPRRSLVLLRSGPLGCREPVLKRSLR